MARGGTPDWYDEQPEHIRVWLLELHKVRRGGVSGLRRGAAIPRLLELVGALDQEVNRHKPHEAVSLLFGNFLAGALDNKDAEALRLYFGMTAESFNKKPLWRRMQTGRLFFGEEYSEFRTEKEHGKERQFLIRISRMLHVLAERQANDLPVRRESDFVLVHRKSLEELLKGALKTGDMYYIVSPTLRDGRSPVWDLAVQYALERKVERGKNSVELVRGSGLVAISDFSARFEKAEWEKKITIVRMDYGDGPSLARRCWNAFLTRFRR